MRASTSRVTGNSLFAGRKFLTPEMKFSKPPSFKRPANYGKGGGGKLDYR